MGSATVGGSEQAVAESIREVKPGAVVMVGIAFGIDKEAQPIGTVLVSKQLECYGPQRRGTAKTGEQRVILRGDRVSASAVLLDRLQAAETDWAGAEVKFGLMASGDVLVDNLLFRKELRAVMPEMIGGEMEGAGLYLAASEGKVDWIICKGVCDWADGKKAVGKAKRQKVAAKNAARFVVHALRMGGFAPIRSGLLLSPL
jgi:nucleoside phosphorylase